MDTNINKFINIIKSGLKTNPILITLYCFELVYFL